MRARTRSFVSWGGRRFLPSQSLPAVEEEVDVSNFSGNSAIDITTIDGIGVKNFTHIQIKMQACVRSASGAAIEIALRREGGLFTDETYRWMETSHVNYNPSSGDFELNTNNALTTHEGIIWLSSVNQPCPTHITFANQQTTETTPAFHRGMTSGGGFVHDAIRFRANGGGGGETWTSGTLVITGYRCKVGTLYTGALSGVPITINLAADETIADLGILSAQPTNSTESLFMEIGTGDVFQTTNYRIHNLDSVGSSSSDTTTLDIIKSNSAQTNKRGFGTFYNLQTSGAPVCFVGQILSDDGTDTQAQEIRAYMHQSTTSYDQIRLRNSGGNSFTFGTYWLQTYKPRQTIHKQEDLTSYGDNKVEVTGLKKNNAALLVVAGYDIQRTGSEAGAWVSLGDNSGYKSDYLQLRLDDASTSLATSTVIGVTDETSKVNASPLALIMGLPYNTNTQVLGIDMSGGGITGVTQTAGSRETRAVENKFKYQNGGGGANFNAGTLYVVGYSL